MIGLTLSKYISLQFLKMLLAIFAGISFLIITVDFIEQMRKLGDDGTIGAGTVLLMAALRAPVFVEKAFPFICLFAAMITLTQLNNKLELVVARSAGVSAWQFLLPISFSAAATGLLVALIYNPLAIKAFETSKNLEANIVEQGGKTVGWKKSGYWIKQLDDEGTSIINAGLARNRGQSLDDVKVMRFDTQGRIRERIDAASAEYRVDHWYLKVATITDSQGRIQHINDMNLPTRLTKDSLLGASSPPDAIPFWDLKKTAKTLKESGTNPNPYMVQYYRQMALPLFFVAMVLVAATVCLRFVRFGQVGRMILGGIAFGFVLYILTNLVTALGSNGAVPPMVAAWSPVIVAILFGISILLHQEDG